MKIITISYEFGSGGCELGKRLSRALGAAYYDREIAAEIARMSKTDVEQIENMLSEEFTPFSTYIPRYPFGRIPPNALYPMRLLSRQREVLERIARKNKDCVIVGHGADVALAGYRPFKIFVYADMPSKIEQCRQGIFADEHLTEKKIAKKIKKIDRVSASYHNAVTNLTWGNKRGYHLCINTSNIEIPTIVPWITSYSLDWFRNRDEKKQ